MYRNDRPICLQNMDSAGVTVLISSRQCYHHLLRPPSLIPRTGSARQYCPIRAELIAQDTALAGDFRIDRNAQEHTRKTGQEPKRDPSHGPRSTGLVADVGVGAGGITVVVQGIRGAY